MKSELIFASSVAIIVAILDISVPEKIKPKLFPIILISFFAAFLLQNWIPVTFQKFTIPAIAFITTFISSILLS